MSGQTTPPPVTSAGGEDSPVPAKINYLHASPVDQFTSLKIHSIEATQALRATTLNAQKCTTGTSLRVLFLLPHIALFEVYASLYQKMSRDPGFTPEILAFRRTDIPHDIDEEQTRAFFVERGIPAHVVGFGEGSPLPVIDPDAYDVLFYTLGSLAYPELYRIDRLSHHFLTCYIAYGVLLANQEDIQFNQISHHAAWRIYAGTSRDMFFYDHFRKRIRSNARLTGHPKFDLYCASRKDTHVVTNERVSEPRPVVIWAPHWSIGLIYPRLNNGMFDKFCMGMLELMDEFSNVDFVFRPHPNLRYALARTTFMNEENYRIYHAMMKSRSNCRIDQGGGNIDLFLKSSAMITDSISFLAEYLPTGNPLLFLDRPDRARMNEQGEALVSLHFRARTLDDIRNFIKDHVVEKIESGTVPLKAEAERVFSINNYDAAGAIMSDLRISLLEPRIHQPRRDLVITLQEAMDYEKQRMDQAQRLSNAYWTQLSTYNYASIFPNRHRSQSAFIAKWFIPRLTKEATILDIGCADGWSSCLVAPACKELHGYDLNPAFIDLARGNATMAGLNNCHFEVADARTMKFCQQIYEAAMLSGLLTCIIDDGEVADLLANVSRCVREGSTVLFKDTLNRGVGSSLNLQDGYAAIYRDLATYQNLIISSGLIVVHGEWIDIDESQGSYMIVAERTAPK
jgi:SAM-dependent methyltransferase